VTGGRPTEKSIVDADLEAIQKDIEKLLEVKIGQLGKRVEDLRAGTLTLPDVRMADVQRIWPVVVNSEGLLQTPSLWHTCATQARWRRSISQESSLSRSSTLKTWKGLWVSQSRATDSSTSS